MAQNYRAADLPPRQKAMLDFAVKLTEAPDKIEEQDREALRSAGFSDRDIWDIAAVAAFYNMSNRLAAATDMRPNREYHYMVREPTDSRRRQAAHTAAPACRSAAARRRGAAPKPEPVGRSCCDYARSGLERATWSLPHLPGTSGELNRVRRVGRRADGLLRGMRNAIAVMNTKGGVGKSTLVLAMAETLSAHVPQERADHRFRLAGQRQRHAAVGDQPASPAVGRADHRRPAGGERAQQCGGRLAALRGRRRLRRRRGAHRLSDPQRHAAHPVRARGLQGEPARPPAHQHRRPAQPCARRVRHRARSIARRASRC